MKRILIFLVIMLLAHTLVNAQVPRKVLMEYATNASCPPCAAYNPGAYAYFKGNSDNIVAVWYHAWWPGSGDPMYQANIPENENRIYYYGVNAVPNYMVDGVHQGNPASVSTLSSQVDSRHAIESPISLGITQAIVGDTLEIDIELSVVSEVTATDLKLRISLVEQMMKYFEPPGSNGEKEFPQVFRKFCEGAEGISLSDLNINDVLIFNFKEPIDEEWNMGVLGVVAWVQSDANREVLQAESTVEITHDIATASTQFDQFELNSTITKNVTVQNFNDETLDLKLYNEIHSLADSWEAVIKVDGNETDTAHITLGPDQSKSFELLVKTSDQYGDADITVRAENINSAIHYAPSISFYGLSYGGEVLLMDGDNGGDYEQNYVRILDKMEKTYTLFKKDTYHKVSDVVDLSSFNYMVWVLGPDLPTLDAADLGKITTYLNNGGNLFIAGQDLGYDIHEVNSSSTAKFFYRFHLDAKYLSNTSEVNNVEAVEGNPLFESFNFEISSEYPVSADVMTQERDFSIPVLKYEGTDNYAMLVTQRNQFKTAYMAFGLDQIPTEQMQDELLEAVFAWFDDPTGSGKKSDGLPEYYSLEQNYPNPFNPATVINYQLADGSAVNLSVYNTLGEEVAVLVSEYKNAGYYSVNFNAAGLSSGIYFYKISANDFYQVNKMLLVK